MGEMQVVGVKDLEKMQMVSDEIQVVAFRLNDELIGTHIEKVVEITKNKDITPVPKAPKFVIGVMNLRGKIVPVVTLKGKLGLKDANDYEGKELRIVIVDTDLGEIGIVVDEIVGALRINKEDIQPPPLNAIGIDTVYIKGVVQLDSDLLVLLDIDAIFNKDEDEKKR